MRGGYGPAPSRERARQVTTPLVGNGARSRSAWGSGTAGAYFSLRIRPKRSRGPQPECHGLRIRQPGGEQGLPREIQKMLGTDLGIASVNGSGAQAEWGRAGGSPGPFGLLLRRDRDPGRPRASVSRPRHMGMLTLVPVGLCRYVSIRLLTATNRGPGTVRLRCRAGRPASDGGRRQPLSAHARL